MPDIHHTTWSDHVALYERLVRERDGLAQSFGAEARKRPDAAAPAAVCAELSRIIHGARRITARMPGGARLPFRPIAVASNAEVSVLIRKVGAALTAYDECYRERDDNAGEEDEKGPLGDFVWNTID